MLSCDRLVFVLDLWFYVSFPTEELVFPGNIESVASITGRGWGLGAGGWWLGAGDEWRSPRGDKLGGKMNLFKFKKPIYCAQNVQPYKRKCTNWLWPFFSLSKFVIPFRNGHCYCSPRLSQNLATPLPIAELKQYKPGFLSYVYWTVHHLDS